jgi:hypothetical protein
MAFVLHDMFAVPFEDIAPPVDPTSAATRQPRPSASPAAPPRPRLICLGSVRVADVARHTVTGPIDLILDPAGLRAFVVDD